MPGVRARVGEGSQLGAALLSQRERKRERDTLIPPDVSPSLDCFADAEAELAREGASAGEEPFSARNSASEGR